MSTPVCEAPIKRGPNQGKPATGTHAGAIRHWRAGESLCEECREFRLGYAKDAYWTRRRPERVIGEGWCLARIHRLEGDNLYITPSTGERNCRACKKERENARERRSGQCGRCGVWFIDDESFDRHQVWVQAEHDSRCLSKDEMKLRGMNHLSRGIWAIYKRRRTHCLRGHPLRGKNVILHKATGKRQCRICQNENRRRLYAERKAKA